MPGTNGDALLQSPTFILDSHEKWRPTPVEEFAAIYGYEWADGHWAKDGEQVDALDFPANMTQPDLPLVGYHRTQKGGGLDWGQWWLFYPSNPWDVLGIGMHEGDWEFIQIGYTANGDPIQATYSQHHAGGKRDAWIDGGVEMRDGRPIAYVALGSHAHYFTPGLLGGGIDRCDGKGDVLASIEWRPFGPWASWPGKWGHSDNSPRSPARQGHRWSAPHLFNTAAK